MLLRDGFVDSSPHRRELPGAYNGYRFDLSNDEAPVLAFEGLDVTDPATFVVPELR